MIFFFSWIVASALAQTSSSLSLKPVQSIVIDTKEKFESSKLGGFSGLYIKGNDFYVISDDRGRFGDYRIYKWAFSNTSEKPSAPKFELKLTEKISLFKKTKKMKVFDFEALAPFKDGWLVSSEGDFNSRPKELPEVLFVKDKTAKPILEIPDEFVPKFKGKQTAGTYNNKAFEGLFFDEPSGRLYLASESGLLQKTEGDMVYYLLEYKLNGDQFKFDKKTRFDFNDRLDASNLYNGVSEITLVSENTLLMLTRSVQASFSLQYSNVVWLLKRKTAQDPWEVKDKYVVNPQNDKEDLNQNFEGMVVVESKGVKYLVLVSDDNFNSFEKTVFSFFELEVK